MTDSQGSSKDLSSERLVELVEHFQGAITDMVLMEPTDSEHAMAIAESVCYVTDAVTALKELQSLRDSAHEPPADLIADAIREIDAFCDRTNTAWPTLTALRVRLAGAYPPPRPAQPPAPEWQPIETAPTDGTPILVSNDERDGAWIAYYYPVYSSGYRPDNPWSSLMLNTRWHKNDRMASHVPTRWMPIPAVATPTKEVKP